MSVVRVCQQCKGEVKPPIWGPNCRKCSQMLTAERTELLKTIHWESERADIEILRAVVAKFLKEEC